MMNSKSQKIVLAGVLAGVAVAGSLFSLPVLGSKCAPVQHMVNILCGVLLGPGYAVGAAFTASLLRNLLGLGSILAFPGSMFGALLCGLAYRHTHSILTALLGEVLGTAIIGGLCAYPLAILFLGQSAGSTAFYIYIMPFFISTAAGALISAVILYNLQKATNVLQTNGH
ncbi:MAG: energy coupling factor transporter S component ThiW [Selenomonas sp.]|nr:energy coupling factor transporter S component ThiW [Selenomonas sp.]MCR5757821.1 energy coupling factor transporter S component ThiW [Selenomonas sp.]